MHANFKRRLQARGYPKQDRHQIVCVHRLLSEVNFDLKQKQKSKERLYCFFGITQRYKILKEIDGKLESKIEKQFLGPPIVSYKRGKSRNDMLVRGKM